MTDPENKIVLDILPERYKPYLTTYLCKYPKEEREKVKYFVSDMWRTYYDTAGIWFKNAIRLQTDLKQRTDNKTCLQPGYR